MFNPWSAELWRLAATLMLALLAGGLLDMTAWALVIALGGYLFWHLSNLKRLERWLRKGNPRQPPEASGIWEEIYYRFYRVNNRSRQRKKRLAAIVTRFREATAALPDATVVIGSQGQIEWFNTAAGDLLGLHTNKDVGQRIYNLIRHPQFAEFLHDSGAMPLEIPSPLDDAISLNIRIIPYGKDQRLLVARDVSQRRQLEQMRRDFVANVSHEMRTPLTVVMGMLETMQDASDDECIRQWERALQLMSQQTHRMQQIVADLLLLSRLESERAGSGREVVNVAAMLDMVMEASQPLAEQKGQSLTLSCDSALKVYGFEKEIYSAFSNLVTNAVRYTPEGGEIAVRWFQDEAGAHFEVKDSGVGVAAEHIPRLTERFYRVDVGRSRDSGGTGLGLAIVKHVLNRHDASLGIASTPGRGSTFSCHFPRKAIVG